VKLININSSPTSSGCRSEILTPTCIPARDASLINSFAEVGILSVNSLKKEVARNFKSTPSNCERASAAFSAKFLDILKVFSNPSSPLASMLAPAIVATKDWLEQIFEVAFSLRICCSRVERMSALQTRPFKSVVFPI
jgi:hypothetical protein